MSYDDATVPIHLSSDHPTWPGQPPSPPSNSPRPARPRASFWPGCGVALAITGAFIAGALISALIVGALFAQAPAPATSANPTNGALKVTITDAFLNEAFNASGSNGTLTNVQTHIQANGKLTISGVLQSGFIASGQTAVIVLEPSVSQGKITVQAVSGAVGGFPLPGLALAPITTKVNEQLAQASNPSLGGGKSLTAQAITFADGEMTIIYV